jgi:hypothetical protein
MGYEKLNPYRIVHSNFFGLKKLFALGFVSAAYFSAVFPYLSAQNRESRGDVRFIRNTTNGTWGSTPKVELKFVRKLGDVDSDNENLAFQSPGDMVEDRAQNIYIADENDCRIMKFDKDGNFLKSFGRKGQGPGEFSSIRSLTIDSADQLHALDASQRRIQIFSTDGLVLQSSRLLHQNVERFKSMMGGLYLAQVLSTDRRTVTPSSLLKILDIKELVQGEFCTPFDFNEIWTNRIANFLFFTVGQDGTIIVSFAYQNRIEKYTSRGKLVWMADRPLNFETKLLAKGKIETSAKKAQYTIPRMNTCSGGVALDGFGRIWVVTYRRQIKPEEIVGISISGSSAGETIKRTGNTDLRVTDMYQLEVFDREGILLGVIPLSHFVDGIWIFQDRLYLLDRDRGATYYQYRIEER